jgi:glycosyltransferase involved in cell wall biosynthesis
MAWIRPFSIRDGRRSAPGRSCSRWAPLVRERVPDVLFRILGEPADREYVGQCQQLVRERGIENNVSFGVTNESHLAYPEADVFCLPSLSEAMPYALLEAMMSGCPAVCSDVGNVREIVADTGLLVRPRDPVELASALLKLLDGPGAAELRRKLSNAALERARLHFQISTCVEHFRRIYADTSLTGSLSRTRALPSAQEDYVTTQV